MPIVTFPQSLMSLTAVGKFGFGQGYGGTRYGKGVYGSNESFSGIYQRRMTKQGGRVLQMKHYRPTNPRSPAQQAWRAKFADARSAYGALTSDQKLRLSNEARKVGLLGFNLFIQRYLQGHRS